MSLVTIYIPTRNRIDLLKRAIFSCLNQSYPHLEIIVVDDNSDAEVKLQVKALEVLDPRITVVLNDESGGACKARNTALALAKGEFVTGLDDDDEFTPERVQTFINYWRKNPDVSFLSSGYLIKTAGNKQLSSSKGKRHVSLSDLLFSNIVGNQVFTKTSYLKSIAGFDVQLPSCQDYDTWIRLASSFGDGLRCPEISYIVHQDHGSERISTNQRRLLGYQYLYLKHQHLMSEKQKASQSFFQKLYTGDLGLWQLLKIAPLRQYPVAAKVYLLRRLGYQI
jgi:glycosyltransferase involved in cell wall biosynthesis